MLYVKTLPCVASIIGRCDGVIEADHAGRRGISQKAHDNTCIPLCTKHHRERDAFTGDFKAFDHDRMRGWLAAAVWATQLRARNDGIEVPTA